MSISALFALGFLLTCLFTEAGAAAIPACEPLDSTVQALPFPNGMPDALLKVFRQDVGDIASPGERFDSNDVVLTGRNRRVIFVWKRGMEFLIATEHGGIAYNTPIFVYRFDAENLAARLLAQEIADRATVCVVSQRLIGADSK